MANGLSGVDFVHCWISWSILPLSRRSGLMCEYTGDVQDSQRHINIQLTDEEVTECVKKMLNEPEVFCSKTGLSPFYTQNKPPTVSIVCASALHLIFLDCATLNTICPFLNRVMIRSGKRNLRRKR